MIRWLLRSMLPKSARLRLRSSPMMRKLAQRYLGGVRSRPFPHSNLTIYFDGFRNFGLSTGNLDDLEREERAWVQNHFAQHRPKVIWDIGANIGFWSLFFSALTDRTTLIRCFEPDPDNLRYLELNRTRNDLSNWTIRPIGLSDHVGQATFFTDPVTGCTGSVERIEHFSEVQFGAKSVEINIPLTTIDQEVADGAPPPDFIKMDVEAHELAVLRGGRETLLKHRPVIVFEAGANYEILGQFFRDCGYALQSPTGEPLQQPGWFSIAVPR